MSNSQVNIKSGYKFICVLFLTFLNAVNLSFAQTETEILNKLEQYGIHSEEDIKAELQKRNMTEEQARQLASLYGLNYDEFITKYIIENKPLNEPPTNVSVQPTVTPDTSTKDTIKQPDGSFTQEQVGNQTVVTSLTDTNSLYTKNGIPYFGYKIFSAVPPAFEPTAIGPIDPGYLISPGDILKLTLWGEAEFQYELTVDNRGNIFVPTVGQIFVLGVAYSDLKNQLTSYLSQYYQGLTTDPPTVFLDVSFKSLSPLRIFALGEVQKPGGYNISSFATVFNALYSIGGPTISGSLRDIRIIRNSKVVTAVDLYDYLLKGKLIGDIRLMNNDIIFVPPRLKTVTITGEILRPAIYELKQDEGIMNLIDFAGGLKSTAYTGRVQIKRIIPFENRTKFSPEREIIDIDLSQYINDESINFELFDGDEITVFPILEEIRNFVTIEGAVYRPGTYEIKNKLKLSELIREAYGLLPEAYLLKADITRTNPDKTKEFYTINLDKALKGDPVNDIYLQQMDQIKIYSKYEIRSNLNVSIEGYVKNPFTIPYADSLTLFDMIFKAGGLLDPVYSGKAYTVRGDIIRLNSDGVTTTIVPFDLNQVLNSSGTSDIDIKPGDVIKIYNAEVVRDVEEFVRIEGEIRKPGRYPLSKNMTPMDLILQAGGFLETSLRSEVYVNRINPEGYQGEKISETYKVPLPLSFDTSTYSPENKFILKNNDVIVVRKNPEYENQRIVKIFGEVLFPGTYVLTNKNQSVYNLLNEAGGPTSEAYLFGSYFSRGGERLIVNLEELFYNKNFDEDVILRENDSIFIPQKPNTVLLSGEVNNPGLFKFVEGEHVLDYIEKSGGLTNNADYAIYSKPNGESIRVDFGLFSSDPEVYDGSLIRIIARPVENDTTGIDWGKTITDVFAIASSVLTILVLSSKL
ncbi:MAG: SLBB domain-containing protein [Ignavibacteriaceae bacterium]